MRQMKALRVFPHRPWGSAASRRRPAEKATGRWTSKIQGTLLSFHAIVTSKSAYFPVFGRKKARQKRPFKNGQTFPLLGGRFNCSDEFSVQSRYRNAGPTGTQAAKRRAAGASRPVHNGQRAPAPLRYAAGRTGRNESHGRRRSRCRCSRGRHD